MPATGHAIPQFADPAWTQRKPCYKHAAGCVLRAVSEGSVNGQPLRARRRWQAQPFPSLRFSSSLTLVLPLQQTNATGTSKVLAALVRVHALHS